MGWKAEVENPRNGEGTPNKIGKRRELIEMVSKKMKTN